MSRDLIIPDLHLPFQHKRALSFCKALYSRFNCNRVICTGDILDLHQISRHTSEPDAMSAMEELSIAKSMIKKWGEVFPKMDIVLGNHDKIPKRQAKEVGLPSIYLKSLKDVYKMPKGWKFHNKLVTNNTLYLHSAGSGKFAVINKAREMSMNVVAGHTHKHGGVIYFSNPNHLYFGLQVACLIDKEAYAMRYSDAEITLGAGVNIEGREGFFIPMAMGKDLKRYKKNKEKK